MSAQLKQTACALLLMLGVFSMGSAAAQSSVVYHLDNASIQGLKGLRNIRNHLDVAPQTKIVVVTHAEGVDLLIEGAKDEKNAVEYAPLIAALKSRGVRFEVCEITLKNRKLNKDQFILCSLRLCGENILNLN